MENPNVGLFVWYVIIMVSTLVMTWSYYSESAKKKEKKRGPLFLLSLIFTLGTVLFLSRVWASTQVDFIEEFSSYYLYYCLGVMFTGTCIAFTKFSELFTFISDGTANFFSGLGKLFSFNSAAEKIKRKRMSLIEQKEAQIKKFKSEKKKIEQLDALSPEMKEKTMNALLDIHNKTISTLDSEIARSCIQGMGKEYVGLGSKIQQAPKDLEKELLQIESYNSLIEDPKELEKYKKKSKD